MSQESKPLTEEELLDDTKSFLASRLEYLKSCNDYFTKEAYENMEDIRVLSSILYVDDDYKKICSRVVDFMLGRGLVQMIVKVLRSFIAMAESRECMYKFREQTGFLIYNLTYLIEKQVAERVQLELVKCGAVKTLLTELNSYDPDTEEARQRFQIISCIFETFFPIRTPNAVPLYRASNVVNILMKFVEADDIMTKTLSLVALAWVVNEKESEKLVGHRECFVTLVETLQKAVSSEDKKYRFTITVDKKEMKFYLSTRSLAESFANLASNDVNKNVIVQHGCVPVLAAILRPEYTAEDKRHACTALWKLAFLENNLDVILAHLTYTDTAALQELQNLRQSDDLKLRDVAQGLLHQLGLFEIHSEPPIEGHTEEVASHEHPREPAPRIQQEPRDPPPSYQATMEAPHIMISYKWDQQENAMKVCKKLKENGYNVWMDVEKLEGNILIAMANAVEKADAILVCVSQSYKASVHCQTEAHYAYQQQKPIIPVMVEEDYAPDGWLGALTAMKKYIRAYSDDVFEQDMPHLIRELGNRGRVV